VIRVPEKAIFQSVTEYNNKLSSQCTLSTQIKQVQDKNILFSICKDDIGNLK
jgi:hypothetical protein